jgi:hypothetical protein
MKWVLRAQDRGAKLIVVDPRFTRTASKADIYAPMRSGTDIAFLGGMIKYICDNGLYFRDYVANYTNAAFLVDPEFKGPSQLDGLFSGYNDKTRKYDKKTWAYQMDEQGIPKKDPSLKNPNCVFQQLRKHYERYNPDKVSEITGTPKENLKSIRLTPLQGSRTGQARSSTPRMDADTIDPKHQAMSIIQLLLEIWGSQAEDQRLRGKATSRFYGPWPPAYPDWLPSHAKRYTGRPQGLYRKHAEDQRPKKSTGGAIAKVYYEHSRLYTEIMLRRKRFRVFVASKAG